MKVKEFFVRMYDSVVHSTRSEFQNLVAGAVVVGDDDGDDIQIDNGDIQMRTFRRRFRILKFDWHFWNNFHIQLQ